MKRACKINPPESIIKIMPACLPKVGLSAGQADILYLKKINNFTSMKIE